LVFAAILFFCAKRQFLFLKRKNNFQTAYFFLSPFSFFLDKKRNKKIKAANKKAEDLDIRLRSKNSPEEYNALRFLPAQTVLIFNRRISSSSSTFYSRPTKNMQIQSTDHHF